MSTSTVVLAIKSRASDSFVLDETLAPRSDVTTPLLSISKAAGIVTPTRSKFTVDIARATKCVNMAFIAATSAGFNGVPIKYLH